LIVLSGTHSSTHSKSADNGYLRSSRRDGGARWVGASDSQTSALRRKAVLLQFQAEFGLVPWH